MIIFTYLRGHSVRAVYMDIPHIIRGGVPILRVYMAERKARSAPESLKLNMWHGICRFGSTRDHNNISRVTLHTLAKIKIAWRLLKSRRLPIFSFVPFIIILHTAPHSFSLFSLLLFAIHKWAWQ